MWSSPEILRHIFRGEHDSVPYNGTQKGDIYSFGIILHEILVRQENLEYFYQCWHRFSLFLHF